MFLPLIVSPLKRALNIRSMMLLALITSAGILLAACSSQPGTTSAAGQPTAASGSSPAASVSFSKDVQPILQSRCVNCHGGAHTNKGLNLSTYAGVMAGGADGPAVVAGDPNSSMLLQMVTQGKMPKSGPLLQPGQIQILNAWVKSGAANN